jgi:hypothetical protein
LKLCVKKGGVAQSSGEQVKGYNLSSAEANFITGLEAGHGSG